MVLSTERFRFGLAVGTRDGCIGSEGLYVSVEYIEARESRIAAADIGRMPCLFSVRVQRSFVGELKPTLIAAGHRACFHIPVRVTISPSFGRSLLMRGECVCPVLDSPISSVLSILPLHCISLDLRHRRRRQNWHLILEAAAMYVALSSHQVAPPRHLCPS